MSASHSRNPLVVRARQADEVRGQDIGAELPAEGQDRVLGAVPLRADDAHELRARPVPIDRVGGPGIDQGHGQGGQPVPPVLVPQVGDGRSSSFAQAMSASQAGPSIGRARRSAFDMSR